MELDTFVITVEDFLAGRIKSSFLKEEIIYTKEEAKNYRQELGETAESDILNGLELVISSLDEMLDYLCDKRDEEYLKSVLEKIKKVCIIFSEKKAEQDFKETKISSDAENHKEKKKIFPAEGGALECKENIADEPAAKTSASGGLISSPTPDYDIPSGMKSKLPPKSYYEKPRESKELKIEYISDPVDSPLYSLLLSYQEFHAKQIDVKIWVQRLVEAEEELNYLLDKEEYTKEIDIEKIDDLKKLILQALRVIEYLQIESSENKSIEIENKIEDFITTIRKLNLSIYEMQEEISPVKSDLNIKDSIIEAYEKFEEEDYKTDNYILIEDGIKDFLLGDIGTGELLTLINKMKTIISNAQEQYENLPVTQEELTLEVLRGDKLLNEGFLAWVYGLEILEDALDREDKESLSDGLEYIFSANKKLVLVQYFSAQVQKQAKRQQNFTSS